MIRFYSYDGPGARGAALSHDGSMMEHLAGISFPGQWKPTTLPHSPKNQKLLGLKPLWGEHHALDRSPRTLPCRHWRE